MMMIMILFLNSTLLDVKKRNLRNKYTTCKQQRTAKYTYNNTQRSRKRSPPPTKKEKKNFYILCTQTKVQKKVLLNREDLFEPPKKQFNFG